MMAQIQQMQQDMAAAQHMFFNFRCFQLSSEFRRRYSQVSANRDFAVTVQREWVSTLPLYVPQTDCGCICRSW